jgi:hypothetical protein
MPLLAGDKLDHYEVLSLLGKVRMGEVYRAHNPQATEWHTKRPALSTCRGIRQRNVPNSLS